MSEEIEFPKTIEGFGYKFNEKGELRNIETGEKFVFVVKPGDRQYNQRHYEELGEVIGDFIENALVEEYKLIKKIIPVESEEDNDVAKSRIYLSDDAQKCQTLLLLIQGSGVVRPGQWARQVIINDSLELGTMFPYIRKAQELKWGIVIFNPNENYGSIEKDGEVSYCQITGSESPQKHCLYVWEKFVRNARAEKILIVAHSYGGICTTYMLDCFADDFQSRVKGIALTDSVHSSGMIPTHSRQWFSKKAFNWIKSTLPIDDFIPEAEHFYGCRCLSAGHPKHEYTSGVAFESVFEFLQYRSKENRNEIKNETSEQSSVAKDTTGNKDSVVCKSLNEETKPQTQNGSNSITHEKGTEDLQPNLDSTMKTDELSKATTKTSSDDDTGVPQILDSAMKIDEISSEKDTEATEKDTKANGESQPNSDSAMNIDIEKNTKATEEPHLNSDSAMNIDIEKNTKATGEPQPNSDSAMNIDTISSVKNTENTGESQPNSDSAMNIEPISSVKDTEATGEFQSNSDSAMNIEPISSVKDTEATGESQPNSDSAMNIEPISSVKNTEATGESQPNSDSAMNIDIEKNTNATGEPQPNSDSAMNIDIEKNTNATGEPQPNSDSAMKIDEISSEKDTKATGEPQPNSDSAMEIGEAQLDSVEIVDKTAMNKQAEIVDRSLIATNEINSENTTTMKIGDVIDTKATDETTKAVINKDPKKDTAKLQLKAEMEIALSNDQPEQ